jgi:hypothetical protein
MYGTDLEDTRAESREDLGKALHGTWLSDWKFFTGDEEKASGEFEGKYRGLKLPKGVVDKIYSENAIKWYKLNIR